MGLSGAEKRRSLREPSARPVVVRDCQGRLLIKGRTVNISEQGVFLIGQGELLAEGDEVSIEITMPPADDSSSNDSAQVIHHRAHLARKISVGQLTGLGFEYFDQAE